MSQEWNTIWARAREKSVPLAAISKRLGIAYHKVLSASHGKVTLTLTPKQWRDLADLLSSPELRKYAGDEPAPTASPSAPAASNLSFLLELQKAERIEVLDLAESLKKKFPDANQRRKLLALLTALLA